MFDDIYPNFSYDDNFQDPTMEKTCPVCGTSLNEILSGETVGCSRCYSFFLDEIKSVVIRKQGTFAHVGKIPIKY